MIQLSLVITNNQSVETEEAAVPFGDVNLISGDKLGRDCQIVFPVLDPVVRITPMAFGIVRDGGESRCIFGGSFSDLHAVGITCVSGWVLRSQIWTQKSRPLTQAVLTNHFLFSAIALLNFATSSRVCTAYSPFGASRK